MVGEGEGAFIWAFKEADIEKYITTQTTTAQTVDIIKALSGLLKIEGSE